jgi:hypothetical protein
VPRVVWRGRRVSRTAKGGDDVQQAALTKCEVRSRARESGDRTGRVHLARKASPVLDEAVRLVHSACELARVRVQDVRPERAERARSPCVVSSRDPAPVLRVVKRLPMARSYTPVLCPLHVHCMSVSMARLDRRLVTEIRLAGAAKRITEPRLAGDSRHQKPACQRRYT